MLTFSVHIATKNENKPEKREKKPIEQIRNKKNWFDLYSMRFIWKFLCIQCLFSLSLCVFSSFFGSLFSFLHLLGGHTYMFLIIFTCICLYFIHLPCHINSSFFFVFECGTKEKIIIDNIMHHNNRHKRNLSQATVRMDSHARKNEKKMEMDKVAINEKKTIQN